MNNEEKQEQLGKLWVILNKLTNKLRSSEGLTPLTATVSRAKDLAWKILHREPVEARHIEPGIEELETEINATQDYIKCVARRLRKLEGKVDYDLEERIKRLERINEMHDATVEEFSRCCESKNQAENKYE